MLGVAPRRRSPRLANKRQPDDGEYDRAVYQKLTDHDECAEGVFCRLTGVPAVNLDVANRRDALTDVDGHGGEGRRLIEEAQPPLYHLNLAACVGQLALDRQHILDRFRTPQDFDELFLCPFEIVQAAAEINIFLGNVTSANLFTLDFFGSLTDL
jgi:hypothetical protein